MKLRLVVATLALLMVGPLVPSGAAVQVETPLLAVVTLEVPSENPDARPRATVAPGWDCFESRPWQRFGDIAAVELECQPDVPDGDIVSWSCRNPAVWGEGYGQGSLTVTAECLGVTASCTAHIAGYDSCHHVVFDDLSGIPPLRCRVEITGFVAPWRAMCYNDP